MGAFTPIDEIWYPDEDDTAEQNVNLATQAASIEDGIGFRLREQEKLVSAVLTVNMSTTHNIPADANYTVPFIVDSFGYNTGDMTVSNGVITIATPGIYFVSSTLTLNDHAGYYTHSVMMSGVERVRGFAFKPPGAGAFFQYSAQTAVAKLAAGDTVHTRVVSFGNAATIRNISVAGNVMTCTLLKPL